MYVVGIDTTTRNFCIALVNDRRVLGRMIVTGKGFHSEECIVYLQDLLKEHALSNQDIGGYAISIGPGSLTGVRVGLAFLKGIGFAEGKPVIPVETLLAIGYEFRGSEKLICPVLETRRNRVFTALYQFTDSGQRTIVEQSCSEIRVLLEKLPGKEILFIGSGARIYRDVIVQQCGKGAHFSAIELTHPDPALVAFIGLERMIKGTVPELEAVEPIYL
ncbi:MAG: tRNA (adenosine(37)-N6)-threonylcarbamoyltransferase complex dimerization subunit type 1 TsaB [Candidatus Cloacimonadota bacterium]|nr:MAG: tRNA (adenosine(37)-N6)-threonylcarbamoyltransferase complex dimerization subunit type 1 TsaB [Candidatus Cloacimonadota bacterium]